MTSKHGGPEVDYTDPAQVYQNVLNLLKSGKLSPVLGVEVERAVVQMESARATNDPDIYMYVTKMVIQRVGTVAQVADLWGEKDVSELIIMGAKILAITESKNHEYTEVPYQEELLRMTKTADYKDPEQVRNDTLKLLKGIQDRVPLDFPKKLKEAVSEAVEALESTEDFGDPDVYMLLIKNNLTNILRIANKNDLLSHPLVMGLFKKSAYIGTVTEVNNHEYTDDRYQQARMRVEVMRLLNDAAKNKTIPRALDSLVQKAGKRMGTTLHYDDQRIFMYLMKQDLNAIIKLAKQKGLSENEFVQDVKEQLDYIQWVEETIRHTYTQDDFEQAMARVEKLAGKEPIQPENIDYHNPADVRDSALGFFNHVFRGSDLPDAIQDKMEEVRDRLASVAESDNPKDYLPIVSKALSDVVEFSQSYENGKHADHPKIKNLQVMQRSLLEELAPEGKAAEEDVDFSKPESITSYADPSAVRLGVLDFLGSVHKKPYQVRSPSRRRYLGFFGRGSKLVKAKPLPKTLLQTINNAKILLTDSLDEKNPRKYIDTVKVILENVTAEAEKDLANNHPMIKELNDMSGWIENITERQLDVTEEAAEKVKPGSTKAHISARAQAGSARNPVVESCIGVLKKEVSFLLQEVQKTTRQETGEWANRLLDMLDKANDLKDEKIDSREAFKKALLRKCPESERGVLEVVIDSAINRLPPPTAALGN